jgi:hypothetical protein
VLRHKGPERRPPLAAVASKSPKGNDSKRLCRLREGFEAVKKSTIPVILSEAKNLQLFVFKKVNADASLRSA